MASKKANSKKQKDLDGLAETLASLIIKLSLLLTCVAVLFVAYLITRHSYQPTFNSLVVNQSSSTTIAKVESSFFLFRSREVRSYVLSYSFYVEGMKYSGVDKIPATAYSPAMRSVEVKYFPNNPNINQLKNSYNHPALVLVRLIGAIAITLLVLLFVSLFSNIKMPAWILIGVLLIALISMALSRYLASNYYFQAY